MKRLILIVLVVCFTSRVLCQGTPEAILAKISPSEVFVAGNLGQSAAHTFANAYAKDELAEMLTHETPLVRVYAYWALALRYHDYHRFLSMVYLDTSLVEMQQLQCRYIEPKPVGELVFKITDNLNKYFGNFETNKHLLDSLALFCSDRTLLCSHKFFYYDRIVRLMNISPKKEFYHALRERAMKGEIQSIIGLSQYQYEEDLPLILSLYNTEDHKWIYGLICTQNFPHPDLVNEVLAIYDKQLLAIPSRATVIPTMLKINIPMITERLNYLVDNYYKHQALGTYLWVNVKSDKSHPLRKALVRKIGFRRLEKSLSESKQGWRRPGVPKTENK